MNREAIYTLAIYAILFALAATSWAGLALAAGWLGIGAWMVWRTRSRGLLADVSFMATWPLYVALGK